MYRLLICLVLLWPSITHGQRVANFAYKKFNAKDFETYAFWVNANQVGDVNYSYKTPEGDIKSMKLKYEGVDMLNGEKAFKLLFPNNLLLYVIPRKNNTLRVVSLDGKYSKIFHWLYEGPIEGRGTFCEACTENASEATKMLKMYYLK
ncbi:hypothetical protein [Emticicia sp. BO119]|uniref:hypothetical protein n=1 Tax=Emticicia sp. BO119 TaxID=2757768 RepID=UPI0015F0DC6B|nr:hypothetical protein [Emticicia sp. BO119]MBA4853803.1 hypothetical protein [Emticicia sp. BO119]